MTIGEICLTWKENVMISLRSFFMISLRSFSSNFIDMMVNGSEEKAD